MGRKRRPYLVTAEPDTAAEFDSGLELKRLVARERQRSGPGTPARRALEALADRRRLQRQLEDLYES